MKIELTCCLDPMDCALLYTALKKVAILKGLFRVKRDERMVDFLDRDFSRDENKTAAIKNAYVLLGQVRSLFGLYIKFLSNEWS